MRISEAIVSETLLLAGQPTVSLVCAPAAIPRPGQYVMAHAPDGDEQAALAAPLFYAASSPQGFIAAPPAPEAWRPGEALVLRGPLGRGFSPLAGIRRLGLAALGETALRLLPLAAEDVGAVTLFCDAPPAQLPAAIEALPLGELPAALGWADFWAFDLPAAALAGLRARLGLAPGERLPCPAQALLVTAMPCGGLAECGVCSLPATRGHWLACKDGPVFDLDALAW